MYNSEVEYTIQYDKEKGEVFIYVGELPGLRSEWMVSRVL